MNSNEYKKWYLVIAIFAVIFTFFGGSLAYWQWTTNETERTSIALTVKEDFRCDADGGGDISNNEKYLVPTDCTNSDYAIQRTVTVKPTLFSNELGVDLDLWLNIDNIGTGLKNSNNFKYALTKSNKNCTSKVVASGTFKGKSNGSKVTLLDKGYNGTVTETYYLYIWLDKAETSTATMDQEFSLSLGGECISTTEIEPEAPVLDEGMIPIKLSNTGVATTVSSTDDTWYNYENKEWANIVLVDSDSRSTYLNTTGKTVNQDDILAYYVWIPRYKYRITGKCSGIDNPTISTHPDCYAPYTMSETDKTGLINWWKEFHVANMGDENFTIEQATSDVNNVLQTGKISIMGGDISICDFVSVYNVQTSSNATYQGTFNGNNTTSGPNAIDISFERTTSSISNGDAVETYKTHPSFIWDGETIGGLWVGKFEITGDTTTPTIKPNVSSLRNQNVSNQFQTSLKFSGGTMNTSNGVVTFAGSSTYGLTAEVDSHMMKNSEWGAVAYLSHSKYGINYEIRINNNNSFTTGCGASEENAQSTSECQIAYGGVSDGTYPQSTTGNITGVFDMSGGAWEYVMGVLSDSNGNPRSGNTSDWNSGFNGILYDSGNNTSYTVGISFPNSKYYDLYLESQFSGDFGTNMQLCTLETCGGHALNEITGWYKDSDDFVGPESPWFVRGGEFDGILGEGAFDSFHDSGYNGSTRSWRSVLVAVDGA